MDIEKVDISGVDIIQAGKGPDLVLLHSLLAERSVFDEVLPELAKNFRVTLPNLPGFGGTAALDNLDPHVDDYADFIFDLMQRLNLTHQTTVLGNGAGGFMAVSLAIKYGNYFDKLILADTGHGFPEEGKGPLRLLAKRVEEEGMKSILDAAMARMFPESFINENPETIAIRKTALSKCDPQAFAATARALSNVDMSREISGINNPTLIMVGLEDKTTPPNMSYSLHKGITGASLVTIPNCGHCPQIQSSSIFLKEIKSFLIL
jgi:3-oxoadipate enol-lactonase|tara:strand:- start:5919 stop:6707 length:789 start_codon:yes stop_codon:yes gene_type:complete